MAHPPWNEDAARAIAESLKGLDGALLPMLHALQQEFGYIDDAAVPLLADVLNISRAEVVGVIHFYHDFRHEAPARHTLRLCRAEACQAMGSEALVAYLEGRLGIRVGETSADSQISLEAVYCLGNCALSPAIMLDGRPHGRVNWKRADELLAEALAEVAR